MNEGEKERRRFIGKHAKRMEYPCAQSDREKVFAEAWEDENNPPDFLNYGLGVLDHLLCVEPTDPETSLFGSGVKQTRVLTPEEILTSATVIQWLGTHCGWCWLEQCIRKCGYTLVRRTDA